MTGYLKEIADKLWNVGKLAIPGVALFEMLRYLLGGLIAKIKDWFLGLINGIKMEVVAQMQALEIDLSPPPAFQSFVAKLNVVIPLSEMWQYFLLYLGIASTLIGIKWMRNLIPGLK